MVCNGIKRAPSKATVHSLALYCLLIKKDQGDRRLMRSVHPRQGCSKRGLAWAILFVVVGVTSLYLWSLELERGGKAAARETDFRTCRCKAFISVDIKKSRIPGAGKGAFAKENISAGTLLWDIKCDAILAEDDWEPCWMIPYDDITRKLLYSLALPASKTPVSDFLVLLLLWSTLEGCDLVNDSCRDTKKKQCFLISFGPLNYINHGKEDANVACPSDAMRFQHHVSAAALVAIKNITAGDEILQNYQDYHETDPFLNSIKRKLGFEFEANLNDDLNPKLDL
ncbi:uncharacterized protein LOC106159809 [Lingula anatina]|uniref:Uncharacterized protein LOC106159809 n=1 Tax=Lingula anatina TaxID=7574 RepID=A0A1S3I1G0_LINAN|nr:uncharacterized protein LOC106159809 [Lingula anatina]|eukprot:XP_013391666.1 uncharacterized protein LOC106159809 [Lingula anatina]